ncbi:cytochrome-c peroxidase [Acidobacteria bacterium AH-259-G07]|nr:cytochrome-c peroxidase [Acidobacteria bacterium AH-259-G07]
MKRKILLAIVVIALFAAVLWIYLAERPRRFEIRRAGAAIPIGTPVQIEAPLGLPPVPIPADNPPTAETIALGRRLYYDPILSVDNTVACGTCHKPELGFSDGKPVSQGVHGQKGTRNAPTVFNAAYYTTQFWDGRAPNLEKQAEGPVQNPIEMAHTLEGVEKKLMADPSYRQEFEKAFGPGAISYETVGKAIASFERQGLGRTMLLTSDITPLLCAPTRVHDVNKGGTSGDKTFRISTLFRWIYLCSVFSKQ